MNTEKKQMKSLTREELKKINGGVSAYKRVHTYMCTHNGFFPSYYTAVTPVDAWSQCAHEWGQSMCSGCFLAH